MQLILYTANCSGNPGNCQYPNKAVISNAQEMAKAVAPVRGMASRGPMQRMMAHIMSIAAVLPRRCMMPSFLSMQEEASMA